MDWKDVRHIVIYGYGTIGRACLNSIKKDFIIDYLIDKNAEAIKGSLNGIDVITPEEGLNRIDSQRIIVMTGGRIYREISEYLKQHNLKENEDYCSIEYFITHWYWKYKEMNCVLEIHTALTMACSLKCKNCNMFVPYYRKPVVYDVNVLKEEANLVFQFVDYVFCYTLLGGEPFLYKGLCDIIEYLSETGKVGRIKVITNGTIVPDIKMVECLKRYSVWVSISDYTKTIPYNQKLKEVCDVLSKGGVYYTKNKQDKWLAFGFPNKPNNISAELCEEHMRACSPIFHGYNDKKVYYCHVSWSAEKIGRYKLEPKDYIDLKRLKKEERHKVSLHCLGEIEDGYVSFCRLCGGCGADNKAVVIPGEQFV